MRNCRNHLNRLLTFLLFLGLLLNLTSSQAVSASGDSSTIIATSVTVNGTVRDGTVGGHTFPLYAKIVFTSPSLPTITTFTNPFDGAYSTSLVLNAPYTATITTVSPGYPTTQVSFTPTSNPFTKNFTVKADLTACSAPGYTYNTVFNETFDFVTSPALPSGWAAAKIGVGSTATWATISTSVHPSGIAPVSSPNMLEFNSYTANQGNQALLYRTISTTITSLSTAVISFWMYHDTGYPTYTDTVQAFISINGSSFSSVGSPILRYSATPGWTYHQVDISSYAGPGKPAVYIALLGTSAYGNDIYIDDISIRSPTCLTSAGGLVAGFVSSSPSGKPIISALVSSVAHPDQQAYSLSRGDDPRLRDGFYELFSTGIGVQTFAASAIRHLWAEQSVNVVNNSVTRLDLAPTSAQVTTDPSPLTVYVPAGNTASRSFVLTNTGTVAAAFTLQPAASLLSSGSSSVLVESFPYHEEPANDPTATQTVSASVVPAEKSFIGQPLALNEPVPGVIEVKPVETGLPGVEAIAVENSEILGGGPRTFGIATPFPGTAGYRFATASCDGKSFYVFGGLTGSISVNEVWMYDTSTNSWTARMPMPLAVANMRAACIDSKIYLVGGYANSSFTNAFQIYNTQTNTWISTTQPVTGTPMVVAYNGILYALGGATGSGASKLCYLYNPATGTWSPLADMPTATRYAGAIVFKNKIFVIAGIDTADVQVYTPASNTWDNSGPDLPGPRMDPIVGWYGDLVYLLNGGGNGSYWTPYTEGYMLNASAWPGGSWTTLDNPLPKPKVAPASICAGNRLWSVGGTISTVEERVTQYYDNGSMCNRTYTPVPWLTTTPSTGAIPVDGTSLVTLGFYANAGPYTIPGIYHAALKLNTDAPYALPDTAVTMVVVQISAYLYIEPQMATQLVSRGSYASYVFTITNKSGSTEDFIFGAFNITAGWTATVSPSGFTNLPNNGSATTTVKLYPPAAAKVGDEGVVSMYFQVHDNPSQAASFSAVATVGSRIFIPSVSK
jgi:hypothetical protein